MQPRRETTGLAKKQDHSKYAIPLSPSHLRSSGARLKAVCTMAEKSCVSGTLHDSSIDHKVYPAERGTGVSKATLRAGVATCRYAEHRRINTPNHRMAPRHKYPELPPAGRPKPEVARNPASCHRIKKY